VRAGVVQHVQAHNGGLAKEQTSVLCAQYSWMLGQAESKCRQCMGCMRLFSYGAAFGVWRMVPAAGPNPGQVSSPSSSGLGAVDLSMAAVDRVVATFDSPRRKCKRRRRTVAVIFAFPRHLYSILPPHLSLCRIRRPRHHCSFSPHFCIPSC